MAGKFKVPRTFTVPDTIEGVVGLLTARGWEKAAIVYAYTKPSQGKRSDLTSGEIPQSFPCSYSEFAALGITGLRERHEVEFYRKQWVKGIEEGWAEIVGPGDTIDVPDPKLHPFPVVGHDKKPTKAEQEAAEQFGVSALQVARIANQPKLIQAAVTASEKAANAAWEILADEDEVIDAEVVEDTPPSAEVVAEAIKRNPTVIKDAIKSDRKVREAVEEGQREHFREKAEATRERFYREKGQEPPKVDPDYRDADEFVGGGVLGEAMTALDAEIENGEAEAWINGLLRVAKALRRNISKGIDRFGYTADPALIEKLRVIQSELSEGAFAFGDGFIAEGLEKKRS